MIESKGGGESWKKENLITISARWNSWFMTLSIYAFVFNKAT